jgi:hypothetical protein
MDLDEYRDHVTSLKETQQRLTKIAESWGSLNRTLYILLNELHARHDLTEFCTLTNDQQDFVRLDVINGVVTMEWKDGDTVENPEVGSDEDTDISPPRFYETD